MSETITKNDLKTIFELIGFVVTSIGISNTPNGGISVSGSPVTGSGTISIGHSNVLSSAQTTQAVYPIKIDKNGHISAYGSAVTIPTSAADVSAVATSAVGANSGVCPLNSSGKIDATYLPVYNGGVS